MEGIEQRVRHHLLARLRHRAVLDLYDTAAAVGLLDTHLQKDARDGACKTWSVAGKARRALTGTPAHDRKIIERMLRSGAGQRNGEEAASRMGTGNAGGHDIYDWSMPEPAGILQPQPARKADAAIGRGISFSYVSGLVREQSPAPAPMHVAVVLLLARAVGTSLPDLSMLMEALRLPAPFVLVKAPVAGFEASVGSMLEDGLLLPFPAKLEDVLLERGLSGRYGENRTSRPPRNLKTIAGTALLKHKDHRVRSRLRQAMTDEPAPILAVDETPAAPTPVLTETADLVVECMGFDRTMIADLLHVCVGVPVDDALKLMEARGFDPRSLSIDDLLLAVRPGRSVANILSVLAMLVDRCTGEDNGSKRDAAGSGDGDQRNGGGRTAGKAVKEEAAAWEIDNAGFDVINPATLPGPGDAEAKSSSPQLSVEHLSGYGAARDWALDLKTDLSLWRERQLSWPEMSTRLLLSGPPGTGKTTFAKALCNSLQVPMLATSVASWLEPGYLGDVLKLMSSAFKAAQARAPAILFIDEIDNIGTRQNGGHQNYADYWASLINRLLELIDGAAKTEGVVIVAATNLPDKIDPALLRSGRLETHVRIPMPDIETLTGILAHHLGNDLPNVLSSAPVNHGRIRLRPPPSRDHDPGQLRRNAERRKTGKGKGVSP